MMPLQSQQKKTPRTFANDNILEAIRGLTSGVATDALRSVVGSPPKTGEMKPGEAVDLTREREVAPQPTRSVEMRQQVFRAEEQGLKQKIDAIRQELKMLASSIKQLNAEVGRVVSEVPVAPGVYHLNFFERLKGILKVLRQQVEDSRNWLNLWTNRKEKKQFWGLYKKHGTKFGLSSERTMATQAG